MLQVVFIILRQYFCYADRFCCHFCVHACVGLGVYNGKEIMHLEWEEQQFHSSRDFILQKICSFMPWNKKLQGCWVAHPVPMPHALEPNVACSSTGRGIISASITQRWKVFSLPGWQCLIGHQQPLLVSWPSTLLLHISLWSCWVSWQWHCLDSTVGLIP